MATYNLESTFQGSISELENRGKDKEEVKDNQVINSSEDVVVGDRSAVNTVKSGAAGSGSVVRAYKDGTTGHNSAVWALEDATAGDESAVRAYKNGAAGHGSAVRARLKAAVGDNSVAMGREVEIGSNSVGVVTNSDGEIIAIKVKALRSIELDFERVD